jgi:hypothetical protein
MHIVLKSKKLTSATTDPPTRNIYLFMYVDKSNFSSSLRYLQKNIDNEYITKIFIFTNKELIKNMMRQKCEYVFRKEFSWADIFTLIKTRHLDGYIMFSTPTVYFNETIGELTTSSLHESRKLLCLNTSNNINEHSASVRKFPEVFIFHSANTIPEERMKIFNIKMNTAHSSSSLLYLFYVLGFELYNESRKFQSFQLEAAKYNHFKEYWNDIFQSRRSHKIHSQRPFIIIEPRDINILPPDLKGSTENGGKYNITEDTNSLYDYVENKLHKNETFIIPRIAGIENNVVGYGKSVLLSRTASLQEKQKISAFINGVLPTMKNNAGIHITSQKSLLKYIEIYLNAFKYCETYTDWAPWGAVGGAIAESQQYIQQTHHKKTLWAFVYDVYHTIFTRPWTHALKGKRVLIISSFIESYKQKKHAGILSNIYGIDLFPDCELLFLKPPQTQGGNPSEDFTIELERFVKEIDEIKDQFDVALCSCGGYGNLVCARMFEMGKSSIYVGGVLQMYFGVLGRRWLRERSDIVRLFLNNHWSRPQNSEKPRGFKKVEGSCYW